MDRSAVPLPAKLHELAATEFHMTSEFFRERLGQRRFEFKVLRHPSVREALIELLHGKCAKCETKVLPTGYIDIELFRPKGHVVKRPEHPGYWWLAMAWENFLAICPVCEARIGKANRFPLADESKRSFTLSDDLDEESSLLLDPCKDFPEEHLIFSEDGSVAAILRRDRRPLRSWT